MTLHPPPKSRRSRIPLRTEQSLAEREARPNGVVAGATPIELLLKNDLLWERIETIDQSDRFINSLLSAKGPVLLECYAKALGAEVLRLEASVKALQQDLMTERIRVGEQIGRYRRVAGLYAGAVALAKAKFTSALKRRDIVEAFASPERVVVEVLAEDLKAGCSGYDDSLQNVLDNRHLWSFMKWVVSTVDGTPVHFDEGDR